MCDGMANNAAWCLHYYFFCYLISLEIVAGWILEPIYILLWPSDERNRCWEQRILIVLMMFSEIAVNINQKF